MFNEKPIKILLIDDDEGMCITLSDILETHAYSVTCAGTGKEAIDAIREADYNVALVDIKLPDMVGTEVLKKLKLMKPDIEGIIFTAYASLESALEVMGEAGAYIRKPEYDYILKSNDIPELLIAIQTAVKHQRERKEREQELERYKRLSTLESLTGLYNHRYFRQALSDEVDRAERYESPISLLMMDIDRFKDYNDTYGHPSGDDALKEIARILNETKRSIDVCAKIGGEEFALILPQTTKEDAFHLAERIRSVVEATPIATQGNRGEGRLTISIGIAEFPTDAANEEELMLKADDGLYEAKRLGRNRICFYREPEFGVKGCFRSEQDSERNAELKQRPFAVRR